MGKNIMIIDDDPSVCKTLELLIKNDKLGDVAAVLQTGENACDEILFFSPDIIVIDLLLPVLDGIGIVTAARERGYAGKFIMLSHVSESAMISRAYESGITFFLNKPINYIEAVNIIKNVSNQIDLERSLEQIRNAVQLVGQPAQPAPAASLDSAVTAVFTDIGIVGELGAHELHSLICKAYKHQKKSPYTPPSFAGIYEEILAGDDSATAKKALEQRIRRTIQKALTNLAEIGCNDYANSIFMDYAALLFDFKQVRQEMQHIARPSVPGGKISTKKFVAGVLAKLP